MNQEQFKVEPLGSHLIVVLLSVALGSDDPVTNLLFWVPVYLYLCVYTSVCMSATWEQLDSVLLTFSDPNEKISSTLKCSGNHHNTKLQNIVAEFWWFSAALSCVSSLKFKCSYCRGKNTSPPNLAFNVLLSSVSVRSILREMLSKYFYFWYFIFDANTLNTFSSWSKVMVSAAVFDGHKQNHESLISNTTNFISTLASYSVEFLMVFCVCVSCCMEN